MNLKSIKSLLDNNKVDYFKVSKTKSVFPIGFEQSGNLVIQDENYQLHIVGDNDVKDWIAGQWIYNIKEIKK